MKNHSLTIDVDHLILPPNLPSLRQKKIGTKNVSLGYFRNGVVTVL